MKDPPTPRSEPSLANQNDTHILIIGGKSPVTWDLLGSVDIYDVQNNIWQEGPVLKEPRYMHSSCIVGDYAYVAFGGDSNLECIKTFERLNIVKLLNGSKNEQWVQLQIADADQLLSPRAYVSMSALNENQLLIFGGYNDGSYFTNGLTLDVSQNFKLELAFDKANFANRNWGNQAIDAMPGQVNALVNAYGNIHFVSYTHETKELRSIEDIGRV